MQFEAFLDAELARLGRFAGALTGNRQDAHDVLADALIKVSARWPHISGLEHRTAYVRRVIVTTYLSERRVTTRRQTSSTDDIALLDRPVDDASMQMATRDLTQRLLAQLPRRQRAALVLRYYLDLDDAGIAAAMDTSVSNVRSLISRGLARLRVSADLPTLEPRW